MASRKADLKTRIDTLRHKIWSYKPGKAVPCDDERVVFPDKLVIGMVNRSGYAVDTVPALFRLALHGDVEQSKRADKRQTSTDDQEEYLTDSISIIETYGSYEDDLQDLDGKVGCMVLLVDPTFFNPTFYAHWIRMTKGNVGCVKLCAMLTTGGSEVIKKARNNVKQFGITDIYEVPKPDHIFSDADQLQWLDLLYESLQEGDRALAINELRNICTAPRCRLLYENTKKETIEANRKMFKEVEERRHKIQEPERKCKTSLASYEELVNDNAILKSEMVREKEKRKQVEMTLTENEKAAKHAMLMYKQRELELEDKLKSKELHIGSMAESLQKTEETAKREVDRLQTEKEYERARAEKERCSLAKEAEKRHEDKISEREEEKRLLQRRIRDLEQELIGSRASCESIVSEYASLKETMKVEQQRRQQSEIAMTEKEKRAKHAMEMYTHRELELEEKLKSNELHIDTMAEQLQKTEETAKREVDRLQTEKEDERARSAKERAERRSLAAEMTKKLESKQQHVEKLTEIVGEKERNETTLRQQIEELKKDRKQEKARAETEKRSLAAEMTKKLEFKQQHVDTLTEIEGEKERNEKTLGQQVEELRKGRERDRAQFGNWKKEFDYNEQLREQLERETWKLRTKIQLESEIRSAEQKKKADTHQWRLLRWVTPGKRAWDGITPSEDNSRGEVYSSERSNAPKADGELPNDEFADILKQIADDLSDEAKIDSLGSQLGILQGDIARALKTNMRYEQITSRGTHLMLKQWREGVSSEDERNELRRALVAAKLLDLAVHYLPQGEGTGPEQPQKIIDSHQLLGRDNTPSAQGYSGGQTNTRETTAATDQPRLHDQSSKNQGDEPSEWMDQLSEELSNQRTAGVHDTSNDIPYGGLAGLEHLQKIGEAPGSSGGQNKTNRPSTTTHQALDGTSPTNQREEASEDMDQHAEESSNNNIADDIRETSVDVYSSEPFDEGTSISDERGVECTTINYSDLLSNIASTETTSEKLLIILLMKVIIDIPLKVFGG